jgi:transposase
MREVVRYGKGIKRHFEGIIRAIMPYIINSVAEGINN